MVPPRQYTNFSVMPLSKFEEGEEDEEKEREEPMPEPFRSGVKSSQLYWYKPVGISMLWKIYSRLNSNLTMFCFSTQG